MDLGIYTVDTWGGQVGAGATAPRYCTLNGVAKVVPAGTPPYIVANEHICGRMGQLLGLPVPPGVVVEDTGGQVGYVVLRFGARSERPPPVIGAHLVADLPHMAAGILALDSWVANGDRHAENIAYARGTWPLMVFDHSHAFFGAPGDPAQLQDFSRVIPAGFLGQFFSDPAPLEEWACRIESIRPGVIEDVCGGLEPRNILSNDEVRLARDFLVARQTNIRELLKASLPALQWR